MPTDQRQIFLAAISLLICIGVFELTSADLAFQALFFDASRQRWIWSSVEPVSRFLFYDGAKILLIVFALGLATCLLLSPRYVRLKRYRQGMRIVLLSLMLVPACVYVGKAASNVACPRDLIAFGGQVAYTGVIEGLLSPSHPAVRYQCFPAGHASGGFALLSLFWLFRTAENRRRAVYCGLLAGWVMGAYKIAVGDHFLSHTVATMIVAWLLLNVIVRADSRLFAADNAALATSSPRLLAQEVSGSALLPGRFACLQRTVTEQSYPVVPDIRVGK
jgi:membrane-associated PAP2 superfamily phosphatase